MFLLLLFQLKCQGIYQQTRVRKINVVRFLNTTEEERNNYLSSSAHLITASQRLPSTLATMNVAPQFLSSDHRIIQAGRDFRRSLVQPPAQTRVTWEIRLVVQGFIHLSLKNLQGWRQHNLSGKPVPLLDCPYGESFIFFVSSPNFSSCN